MNVVGDIVTVIVIGITLLMTGSFAIGVFLYVLDEIEERLDYRKYLAYRKETFEQTKIENRDAHIARMERELGINKPKGNHK